MSFLTVRIRATQLGAMSIRTRLVNCCCSSTHFQAKMQVWFAAAMIEANFKGMVRVCIFQFYPKN
jgi:hypothetical protein